MESLETRVKQLEVISDNLDERVQNLDERLVTQESRWRQIWPVAVLYAKRNLLNLITLGIALVSIIMQIVNTKS